MLQYFIYNNSVVHLNCQNSKRMKTLLQIIIILSLIPNTTFAQKSELIIDSVDSKAVIFSKSLVWITNTWKNAKEVIQLKDEESGTIIIKGGLSTVPTSLGMPAKGIPTTQLTIRVKDGKVKLDFENTQFVWGIGTVWTTETKVSSGKKQYDRWHDDILKEIDNLIMNYKEYLTNKKDDF